VVPRVQSASATPKIGDQPVSIDLPNARIAQVVEALGKAHRINVVADGYSDDARISVKMTDVPLRVAFPQLAGLYERQADIVNGVVVLRHRNWFQRPEQEKFSAKHYRLRWNDRGRIAVRPSAEVAHATPASAASANLGATPAVDSGSVPARAIDVEVTAAPLADVARQIAASTGWIVTLEPALRNRRLSASLHRVTPGQALEAITYLMNAQQEVRIAQSRAQKEQEAEMLAQYADQRPEWLKRSDALKQDLLTLLTPEQRAALDTDQTVSLAFNGLPAAVRGRAQDYINLLAVQGKIDQSQFKNFVLEIRPEPGLAVNAWGVTENGNRMYRPG
jgi:type II secretory pathway component GspD/PulD (secretin)